jgi:uncharacterized protein YcbK (DUF882 family)
MINYQVSPHFTFFELTKTDHADLQEANRDVPDEMLRNMYALSWGIFEPIRRHYNRPVHVHSCWRCVALNRALKIASTTSQHCYGQAGDIDVDGIPSKDLFDWIRLKSKLPFGQVIHEPPGTVHISLGKPIWRRSGEALLRESRVDEDTGQRTYGYVRIE